MNNKFLVNFMISALASLGFAQGLQAGENFHFRGKTVDASFTTTSGGGCIVTSVYVFATEGRLQSPPGPGNPQTYAYVGVTRVNVCTSTPLLSAYGSTTLTDQQLQFSGRLESAALNMVVPAFDSVLMTPVNVSVNLTWTGTGPLNHGNSHSHFQGLGFIINSRSSGFFRPAVASGNVSDGITNFTTEPSINATIAQTQNGYVFID